MRTPRIARCDITEKRLIEDITDPRLRNEPIENAEPNDPTLAIDAVDPIEPMERNEFFDAIDRNEFCDQSESLDLLLTTSKSDIAQQYLQDRLSSILRERPCGTDPAANRG